MMYGPLTSHDLVTIIFLWKQATVTLGKLLLSAKKIWLLAARKILAAGYVDNGLITDRLEHWYCSCCFWLCISSAINIITTH